MSISCLSMKILAGMWWIAHFMAKVYNEEHNLIVKELYLAKF